MPDSPAVRRCLMVAAVTVAAVFVVPVVAPLVAALLAHLVATLLAVIAPLVVASVVVAMAVVALPVNRRVFLLVPLVANEIHTFAAGVVAVAVLVPLLGVAGRHAQVERRAAVRHGLDHDRFRIEQRRRRVTADVDAAVKTGLADADRDADVGGMGGGTESGGANRERNEKAFHDESPWLVCGRITSRAPEDRKSTRLNSSHITISYAVFCLK